MPNIKNISNLKDSQHVNIFPNKKPKTIRLKLDEGEKVDLHRHPKRKIIFYLIDGSIELTIEDETLKLEAGDIAHFSGEK